MVVSKDKYGARVPVQIGTMVIDLMLATMTKKELQKAGETWKKVYLGIIVSKRNTVERPQHSRV